MIEKTTSSGRVISAACVCYVSRAGPGWPQSKRWLLWHPFASAYAARTLQQIISSSSLLSDTGPDCDLKTNLSRCWPSWVFLYLPGTCYVC